jgi:hypothetical protein
MSDAVYWLGRKVCDAMADNVCVSAADARTTGTIVLGGLILLLLLVWLLRSGR